MDYCTLHANGGERYRWTVLLHRRVRASAIAVVVATIACGTSDPLPAPTSNRATIAIVGLTAKVQPLTTTPQPGLVYLLTYQLHESGGRIGATAMGQHFAFSNGMTADGNFNSALTPPHVMPGGTITVESSYSIYPASTPAARVSFTVTYLDDVGQSGTTTADADISPVGL